MSDWQLPCGCVAALEPVGYRMAWGIVKRCEEHPSGEVPVPSMALLDRPRDGTEAWKGSS